MAVKGTFIQRLVRHVFYTYYARSLLLRAADPRPSGFRRPVEAHMTEATVFENGDAFRLHCLSRAGGRNSGVRRRVRPFDHRFRQCLTGAGHCMGSILSEGLPEDFGQGMWNNARRL